MSPSLHMSTLFQPSHVTLGLREPGHRPSVRWIAEYLNDLSRTEKEAHTGHYHAQEGAEVLCPTFDVCETEEAFFLEGDFAGLHDRSAITIERLGSRGLLIEAKLNKIDIEQDWGDSNGSGNAQQDYVNGYRNPQEAWLEEGRALSLDHQQAKNLESSVTTAGKPQARDPPHERKGNGVTSLLSERRTGHLQRSFTFPSPITCNGLRARLKDGLLKIKVPKAAHLAHRDKFEIEFED